MVAFSGRVRQWRDDKPGRLAVVDIPTDLVADLGGRRQMRVSGNLNGAPFTASTMLDGMSRPEASLAIGRGLPAG